VPRRSRLHPAPAATAATVDSKACQPLTHAPKITKGVHVQAFTQALGPMAASPLRHWHFVGSTELEPQGGAGGGAGAGSQGRGIAHLGRGQYTHNQENLCCRGQ
jgi:hypothetical protein